MNTLENYYKKVIKLDLMNKFLYYHIKDLPKLKQIILNFGCRNSDLRKLSSALLSLELVTFCSDITVTTSSQSNIFIKVRKGQPAGCKVILEKGAMYNFFLKLLNEVFPVLKDFKGFKKRDMKNFNNFSFTLTDLIYFNELEVHFYLFNNLPKLNVVFVTSSKTEKELIYLMSSFKFPFILNKQYFSICNSTGRVQPCQG